MQKIKEKSLTRWVSVGLRQMCRIGKNELKIIVWWRGNLLGAENEEVK